MSATIIGHKYAKCLPKMLHRPNEDSEPSPVWSSDHSRSLSSRTNRESILSCMPLGVVEHMGAD